MKTDSPNNDPKAIWRNQPVERPVLTPEQIRRKVRELNTKTRWQLLGSVAVLLILAALYGFGMQQFPVLRPLFALALAWSLAAMYFLNRGMWPGTTPGDAAFSTGLEFYRREVERRRTLLSRALLWSFGPALLSVVTAVLVIMQLAGGARCLFPNALPFLTLAVIWVAAYFSIRLREQRRLRREIEELDHLEMENRT